jgi:hypothetical protein
MTDENKGVETPVVPAADAGAVTPPAVETLDAEALKAENDALKASLEGYKNKDYNFKRLRDMTETERANLTATETELKKRQEDLEEKQSSFMATVHETNVKNALAVFAGADEELAKKIEFHYNRLSDPDNSQEEINKKMRDAYTLATGGAARPNPVAGAGAFSSGYRPAAPSQTEFTADQSALAGKLGVRAEDLKNLSNPFAK